ncbi:hypothetical protein Bealeia1_01920 [Candidatus Bealeia paramacronuclearis]|uniref:Uncharacterized protein n=1 Tax=Candidatus Bealeia paramacronuclearis TaxID=1921001 RepID=A0ABZ2C5D5_9PROT|nr:hypothetical protein [Candidatus Bealeia paramacronuclearis]
MKNFIFFCGVILSNASNLFSHPIVPDINGFEFVEASHTKKFQSKDGRNWEFRFHKHIPSIIPASTPGFHYEVHKFYSELQSYDGKIPFAAYEVYVGTTPEKLSFFPDLTFYLLLEHNPQWGG